MNSDWQGIYRNVKRWMGRRGSARLLVEAEPPLRAELFGLIQLESHARTLAADHQLEFAPRPERLLRRMRDNEQVIREAHGVVVEAIRRKRELAPAAEWFLDNHYLIEEQIALTRLHLPARYSRQLPQLPSGLPRVYEFAGHD
ncbi:MAG: hypothetical protein QME60_09465 [Verrucomicrobiota bacterium]|nr:hypothetical protein [Verrucomicrobiota bacterium]